MRAILFHLGPFPVYSFGVMVAAGLVLSLFLMLRSAKKTGFPAQEGEARPASLWRPPGDLAMDMVFVAVLSGFAGARLYYIAQEWELYLRQPLKIFAIWEGGLIFYGGVAGSMLGLWIFLRRKRISFWRGLDFLLPYVALTHAFGRIGCFLNGCCYGKVCDLPWAITVREVAYKVHPTQIYEALFNFFIFFFLLRLYHKKHFEGQVSAVYFMFYAAGRFLIEFFRDNPFFGILTVNQWISLVIFLAASWLYAWKRKASPVSHA